MLFLPEPGDLDCNFIYCDKEIYLIIIARIIVIIILFSNEWGKALVQFILIILVNDLQQLVILISVNLYQ